MSTAARTLAALCLTGALLGTAPASHPPVPPGSHRAPGTTQEAPSQVAASSQVAGTCGAASVATPARSVMPARRPRVEEGCTETPTPPDRPTPTLAQR
jgi:hypothetical protein